MFYGIKRCEGKVHFHYDFCYLSFVVAALNHFVHDTVIKKVDECAYMHMYVISPFQNWNEYEEICQKSYPEF